MLQTCKGCGRAVGGTSTPPAHRLIVELDGGLRLGGAWCLACYDSRRDAILESLRPNVAVGGGGA